MLGIHRRGVPVVAAVVLLAWAVPALAAEVKEVTQYGITWTFDHPVQAGQFVTGDWWVIGPVTVTSITPTPGPATPDDKIETPKNQWGDTSLRNDQRMRNGSMIVLKAGDKQGYDSRSDSYDPALSVQLPVKLEPNRSLISTISNRTVPVANFAEKIMWPSEKTCQNVLQTAAVLTVLAEAPPVDAFRPPYAGAAKPIYRAGQLKWNLLKKLSAPEVKDKAYTPFYQLRLPGDWEQMERYFQRPWLEHMCNWEQQQLNPSENQPNYGREYGRLVSMASLMLNLDVPQKRKEKLLIGLVQYGIDVFGVAKVGGQWNWGGGHTSGRKWPVVFASLMLEAPEIRKLPETAVFHEDAQTYYGTGWFGQTALYWMVVHHGRNAHYEENPPEKWDEWDKHSEGYRVSCNAQAWVGTALAVRLMGAIAVWDHDAFFDYCDRWMAQDDPNAANRGSNKRPSAEGNTFDPFIDGMWHAYRAGAPEQKMAGNPRMFVWDGTGYGFKWRPNPKPDAKAVADHVAEVRKEH